MGKFPASFALNFGPISTLPTTSNSEQFPYNVSFLCKNYVLGSESQLNKAGFHCHAFTATLRIQVDEEYDVILAFSLTKWIHLNWGDDGIKRFFKRVYRNLRPGGRFILETQRYETYRKHLKLHPTMAQNYEKMRFFPDAFHGYLLSEEVGFKHVEDISSPLSISLGRRWCNIHVTSAKL